MPGRAHRYRRVMDILLTGATGFIGSSVLTALRKHGHHVVALVRTDEKAAVVLDRGADATVGDITDLDLLARLVRESDAVIHTASPGDASSATVDSDVVDVVLREFAGTDKPYVHTGGIWVYGDNDDIVETDPFQPVDLTGWRLPIEQRVRDSDVRTTIVAPAIVYGHRGGIPNLLVGESELRLVADGSQHWTTVHVDDLAELYVLAVEAAAQDEYYAAASGENPTVLELATAAARALGLPVVAESADETRARLGAPFTDALLLDQQATGRHAKDTLGWFITEETLLHEFSKGAYSA